MFPESRIELRPEEQSRAGRLHIDWRRLRWELRRASPWLLQAIVIVLVLWIWYSLATKEPGKPRRRMGSPLFQTMVAETETPAGILKMPVD